MIECPILGFTSNTDDLGGVTIERKGIVPGTKESDVTEYDP